MLRRTIAVMLWGLISVVGAGESSAEDSARVAARTSARGAQPGEALQHRLAPMRQGDQRTYNISGRDGKIATAATLTERVTSLRLNGGVLRAEIKATWLATAGRAMTGYSAQRVEEVDRDGVLRATNRLDRAPIPGCQIEGVALPHKLDVGRTWSSRLVYRADGSPVESVIRRRVSGRVLRRVPDGRVLSGVVIEWTETRTAQGAKRASVERWTGTSVFVEGVGELETRMKRVDGGAWFHRKLASFHPGA